MERKNNTKKIPFKVEVEFPESNQEEKDKIEINTIKSIMKSATLQQINALKIK